MAVDYYELLEVARDASEEEIRAAITRQRRIWVRRQSSPDPERRAYAEQRVRYVDSAERILLDPVARRAYDDARAHQAGTASDGGAPGGHYRVPGSTSRRHDTSRDLQPRAHARAHSTAAHRDTTPSDTTPEADLDAHLRRGDAHLDQAAWRRARAEFEYVLERDPGNVRARTGLGLAHVGAGRVKEGLTLLERVLAEHPDDEDTKRALATALYESAVAGLGEVSDARGRTRPMILSRRQLHLVRRHLRRIRRLGLSDWQVRMNVEELADVLAEARKAVWTRSAHLRFYAMLFVAAALLAFASDIESLRVFGAFWMVVVAGLYVLRHRVPAWKHYRRGRSRAGRRGRLTVFRKGI
jgi:tetratricopeptide (TPR) repeat protein